MLDYKIFFIDGNIKILSGENLIDILNYLNESGYNITTIIKIEFMGVN